MQHRHTVPVSRDALLTTLIVILTIAFAVGVGAVGLLLVGRHSL
jgi:hypothetical protein